jgi:RES domain-containing protein
MQPTTLIACEADIGPIFDATDITALNDESFTPEAIAADNWRLKMIADRKALTQNLTERLKAADYAGLQVRSFVRGAGAQDVSLVLWVWGWELPMRLHLVDERAVALPAWV